MPLYFLLAIYQLLNRAASRCQDSRLIFLLHDWGLLFIQVDIGLIIAVIVR